MRPDNAVLSLCSADLVALRPPSGFGRRDSHGDEQEAEWEDIQDWGDDTDARLEQHRTQLVRMRTNYFKVRFLWLTGIKRFHGSPVLCGGNWEIQMVTLVLSKLSDGSLELPQWLIYTINQRTGIYVSKPPDKGGKHMHHGLGASSANELCPFPSWVS